MFKPKFTGNSDKGEVVFRLQTLLTILGVFMSTVAGLCGQTFDIAIVDSSVYGGDIWHIDANRNGVVMVVASNEPMNLWTIVGSTDGGNSWRVMLTDTAFLTGQSPIRTRRLGDIAVSQSGVALVLADSGRLYRTTDFGLSWLLAHRFDREVFFIDARDDVAVVSTEGGVYHSLNRGATWAWKPLPNEKRQLYINEVEVLPNGDIHAIAIDPPRSTVTLLSTDGGDSWHMTPQPIFLLGQSFVTDSVGWAAGFYQFNDTGRVRDVVIHTADAGRTWTRQLDTTSPISGGLISVAFINSSIGFAAGPKGKAWFTSDGGSQWNSFTLPLTRQSGARTFVTHLNPSEVLFAATDDFTRLIRVRLQSSTITSDAQRVALESVYFDGQRVRVSVDSHLQIERVYVVNVLGLTQDAGWSIADRMLTVNIAHALRGKCWLVVDGSTGLQTFPFFIK